MGYYPKKTIKSTHRGVKYAGINLGKRLWVASFTHDNKHYTSPKYRSEILAAKWYDRQALKYLGDRAVLNYPDKLIPDRTPTTPATPIAPKRKRSDDSSDDDSSDDSSDDSDGDDKSTVFKITTTHEDEDTEDATEYSIITEPRPITKSKTAKSKTARPKTAKRKWKRKQNKKAAKPKYETGTKRKKFTQQTRHRVCSRQKWNCNFCKRRLTDVFHIDHMVPLFMSGSNETWNLQSLCPACDKFKSTFIDNSVLFPLSKERKVTPDDVLDAQKRYYHVMECKKPGDTPLPTSPSTAVTNNINLNLGDIAKLREDIAELKTLLKK